MWVKCSALLPFFSSLFTVLSFYSGFARSCRFCSSRNPASFAPVVSWLTDSYTMTHNLCLFFPPSFFQDGLKAVESLKPSIETLSTDLHTVSSLPLYGVSLFRAHFCNLVHACCAVRQGPALPRGGVKAIPCVLVRGNTMIRNN